MQLHIKQLPQQLVISYQARTNILGTSKPALGKSETVGAWAKTMAERVEGFKLWYVDMTTATPNDLMAYMPDLKTGRLVAYPNDDLPNAYTDPDAVGAVLLDEALNADPTTGKVFQKYINGESIGGRLRKPEGVICILMSNRLADKAGVMQQSRALMSRVEQIEIYSDAKHNLSFAETAEFHPLTLKFMEKFPQLIDNYDEVFNPAEGKGTEKRTKDEQSAAYEEGKRGVWANMRSWSRVSKLEFAVQALKTPLLPQRVLSNVGGSVGQQYVTWRAMYDKIASVDDILANPTKIALPTKIDELYVTVGMLAAMIRTEDIPQAAKFIDRLPGDMRAMAIRRMVKRGQRNKGEFDIGSSKDYQRWMSDPAVSDLFMAAR